MNKHFSEYVGTETAEFYKNIWEYIEYWESEGATSREKLEGFAHSILCLFDGVSCMHGAGYKIIDNQTGNEVGGDFYLHDFLFKIKE